ncbi:MAG TPA: amylo-alpha-1,6-glucosidase [Nitrospirales bacterium]|nr:amylo-alpha-1,6-glucosidase [Nitrospirales bacterium]
MEPFIDFGRDICGDLSQAEAREWLVTNGLGGYASGTVAGLLTRRYHGLLVAALKPPVGRTLLVAKLDEAAVYGGRTYELGANRWHDGSIAPHGYRFLERFRLEGTVPVWTYALADGLLEKRIWMEAGANTTYVRYDLARGSGPVTLTARALVNYRDYHGSTRGNGWQMRVEQVRHGLTVTAYDGAVSYHLLSDRGESETVHKWHWDFDLPVERARGLEDREDHLHAGTIRATVEEGKPLTVFLSTDGGALLDGIKALTRRRKYERDLTGTYAKAHPHLAKQSPPWVEQAILAADQFIVDRPSMEDPDGQSVIAGYHWFGDWGRDTMISLPGLTLMTGRPAIAQKILSTFARFVDRGMLPNRFPDAGETPEYNTVDATLWYVEAVRAYHAATGDDRFVRELFPVLAEIVDWHRRGTRYGIRLDHADGLLQAGEEGVQLTWMDAKVGGWVVTPRIGKPVEVNALWYNALRTMAALARIAKKPAYEYDDLAERAAAGFSRYWNDTLGYCYDVLDGPDGDDASLRPNQIFAVSLPASPLEFDQQKAVVDVCAKHLLTSHGLRSLSPDHPQYVGRYGGNQRSRDGAYHQGTVWGWLLGPFVTAHLKVYQDPVLARSFLEPMARQLEARALGNLSEIFDGDPPFTPRGCIAQAWSVAELLRAWAETVSFKKAPRAASGKKKR